MSDASIALNRFGLGGRPGETITGDARRALLRQLDAYSPKPAPIAELAPTRQIAIELGEYLDTVREQRREKKGAMQPAMDTAQAPDMSGAMMSQEKGDPDEADEKNPVKQARAFGRRQARQHYMEQIGGRVAAALDTPAPFAERLVHFWANHFAVSIDKFVITGLAGRLEFDAIRPNLTGSFRDMLIAVERHPAMLLYLDQAQSIGPNSPAMRMRMRRGPRKGGLNENLAREIMELHTLGVRTVYSQDDVTEFARALTGWTVNGLTRGNRARFLDIDGEPGSFAFAGKLHEPGTRTILGKSWTQQGYQQAHAVLDMLSTHPATARHIATKLARHFAGDEPPAPLVARLETAFLQSNGDLPTVYRALIESPECWVDQPVKFKQPWEWCLSAFRALGTTQVAPRMVTGLLNELGQPVWRPGSPAGWDDVSGSWAGPDAILRRVEAAERMAGRTRDQVDARERAAQLFPDALSPATAQSIARAESPGQGVALMLVAPEMMRR